MHTMKTIHSLLLLFFTFILPPAWGEDLVTPVSQPSKADGKSLLTSGIEDGGLGTLRIGNRRIRVEIASTPRSREHGLMQRDYLCDDCGMLFIFEKAAIYSFWMQDTLLPLSIAFIASDGSIINIEEMKPNTTDAHNSQDDALYALEMNSGWFARNNISPAEKAHELRPVSKAR